jgi:hypothetical protein
LIRKWDFNGLIIETIPEKSIIFDARSVGLRLRFSWEIEKLTEGTKVSSTIIASGWIASLFKRKVEQTLTDDLFSWLYALKSSLERGQSIVNERKTHLKPKRRFAPPGPLNYFFRRDKEDE